MADQTNSLPHSAPPSIAAQRHSTGSREWPSLGTAAPSNATRLLPRCLRYELNYNSQSTLFPSAKHDACWSFTNLHLGSSARNNFPAALFQQHRYATCHGEHAVRMLRAISNANVFKSFVQFRTNDL